MRHQTAFEQSSHAQKKTLTSKEINPLTGFSKDPLLLLVPMTFDVSQMLAIHTGDFDAAQTRHRPYEVVQHLVSDALTDGLVGNRLHHALENELRWSGRRFIGYAPADYAELWSSCKSMLDGMQLAAMLWRMMGSSAAGIRCVESLIVGDLKYRAFESLSRPVQSA